MSVWRVGHAGTTCEFTPRHLCGWNNRFDDPKREYRTIYAADKKETCLREILADLRPNAKFLADFDKVFGDDPALASAGRVTHAWRARHALVRAGIDLDSGTLAEIESAPVMHGLSRRLGARLDVAALRSRDRDLTRAASRLLYDEGRAGVAFRSRLDKVPCRALFEGRARLTRLGPEILLRGPVKELLAVCAEYGLNLS